MIQKFRIIDYNEKRETSFNAPMHEAVPAVSKTVMRSERDGLGAVPSGATKLNRTDWL